MLISIVIVNWNTGDLLTECLSSIYDQPSKMDLETIVVDNVSTDESVRKARAGFPAVRFICNDTNVGFAAANNQAIRQAQGQYILLLNPDTVVYPGSLDKLVLFLEECPQVGAAGPRLLNPDRSLQPSCSPEPTLKTEFLRMFHLGSVRSDGYYSMEDWDLEAPRQVDVLLGACLLLRRQAIDQVGLLDEAYFVYSEEVDYCLRLRKAGWRIYWVPQAQVVHYGGQSTRQVAAEMFLQLYQNKIKYFRKHHGWLPAVFYKMILFVAGLGRVAMTPLAWLESSPRRQARLAMVGNYRRLIMALPGM